MKKKYISFENLEVYQLAQEISKVSWEIYQKFNWEIKKIIGEQFITAIDSIGANIAEGYGRYHFLDKIKFFYNARASLFEAQHWLKLISCRGLSDKEKLKFLEKNLEELNLKINMLIKANFKVKNEGKIS